MLSCDEDTLLVAEGNADNKNVSGNILRRRDSTVGYYIRIPENNLYDNWDIDAVDISFRKLHSTEEDKAQLLEWLSNPSVVERAWAENAPWNLDKIEKYFMPDTHADSDITPCFIDVNGETVGYIQYYPIHEDSYKVNSSVPFESFIGGYGIDLMIGYPGLWNKGIGSKIVKQMADYLIHHKGAVLVCSDPEETNLRSVACWKKAGFNPVGLIENYDDPDKQSMLMVYRRKEN